MERSGTCLILFAVLHSVINSSNGLLPSKLCPEMPSIKARNATDFPSDFTQSEATTARIKHFFGMVPWDYSIYLNFRDKKNFSGAVALQFRVVKKTDQIQVHVDYNRLQLDFGTLRLRSRIKKNVMDVCISEIEMVPDSDLLILRLKKPLRPHKRYLYQLKLNFKRIWTDPELPGLAYADAFKASWALHTAFSFRAARKVFPCVDHPIFKTPFRLTMKYPSGLTAASATLPASTRPYWPDLRYKLTRFRRSDPMPTYLLSFTLMENLNKVSRVIGPKGTLIRVFYPESDNEQLSAKNFSWIIDRTAIMFKDMEALTGVAFPLRKLDFIVLANFGAAGLENQGLVSLDYDYAIGKKQSPAADKDILITHEVVHHWVGNYLTFSFWDEVAIQEGLTVFLERIINAKHGWEQKPLAERFVHCYIRGPAVFHNLADLFSMEKIEEFLKVLFKRFGGGNASFREMAEVFREVGSDFAASSFESWFNQSGLPVYITKASPEKVEVNKLRYTGDGYADTSFAVMPAQLNVVERGGGSVALQRGPVRSLNPPPAFLKPDTLQFAKESNKSVVTINENYTSFIVTAYSPKTLLAILQANQNEPIHEYFQRNAMADFFYAFSTGAFSSPENEAEIKEWKEFFQVFPETALEFSSKFMGCYCCLHNLMLKAGQNVTLSSECEAELNEGIVVGWFKDLRKVKLCSEIELYNVLLRAF